VHQVGSIYKMIRQFGCIYTGWLLQLYLFVRSALSLSFCQWLLTGRYFNRSSYRKGKFVRGSTVMVDVRWKATYAAISNDSRPDALLSNCTCTYVIVIADAVMFTPVLLDTCPLQSNLHQHCWTHVPYNPIYTSTAGRSSLTIQFTPVLLGTCPLQSNLHQNCWTHVPYNPIYTRTAGHMSLTIQFTPVMLDAVP